MSCSYNIFNLPLDFDLRFQSTVFFQLRTIFDINECFGFVEHYYYYYVTKSHYIEKMKLFFVYNYIIYPLVFFFFF